MQAFTQIQVILIKYSQDLPVWMGPPASVLQDNPETNLDGITPTPEENPGSKSIDSIVVKEEPISVLDDAGKVCHLQEEDRTEDDHNMGTVNIIKGEIVHQIDEAAPKTEAEPLNSENHDILHGQLNKDFLYPCKQCKKIFRSKLKLDKHVKTHMKRAGLKKHKSEGVFSCPSCSKTFTNKPSLRKHRNTHKIKAICNMCGFKSDNNTKMRQHMLYVHKQTDKDVFLCEPCKLPFATKAKFDAHNEKHATTGFTCMQCPQSFPDHQALKKHRRQAHLRIYCKQCPATFTQANQLAVSIITHIPTTLINTISLLENLATFW